MKMVFLIGFAKDLQCFYMANWLDWLIFFQLKQAQDVVTVAR